MLDNGSLTVDLGQLGTILALIMGLANLYVLLSKHRVEGKNTEAVTVSTLTEAAGAAASTYKTLTADILKQLEDCDGELADERLRGFQAREQIKRLEEEAQRLHVEAEAMQASLDGERKVRALVEDKLRRLTE